MGIFYFNRGKGFIIIVIFMEIVKLVIIVYCCLSVMAIYVRHCSLLQLIKIIFYLLDGYYTWILYSPIFYFEQLKRMYDMEEILNVPMIFLNRMKKTNTHATSLICLCRYKKR